jgi:hypothetical protein
MKKLLLVGCSMVLLTACTIRKEGGTWNVKKTIVDEVKEGVQGTKELVTDLKDANSDLSNKGGTQATSSPAAGTGVPKTGVETKETATPVKGAVNTKPTKKSKRKKKK